MAEKLDKYRLKNGMTVLGEPMEQVGSAAFTFLLPAGESRLPDHYCGTGAVITDWIFRGAGKRNSKELIDELDGLGLHRNEDTSSSHISLGAALEASNLENAIELYADVILRPMLAADQFELSKQLAMSDVIGLDDDPRSKVMINLKEQFYPAPLGRPTIGKLDDLQALTPEKTRAVIKKNFNLSQTVFTIAGKYDFDALCRQLEKLFDIDQPEFNEQITLSRQGQEYTHIQHDGAQVHIGLMTAAVPVDNADYYNTRAAVSVLSGGMSCRLFTEVREKRGLCYAVGARYNCLKTHAGISCYAGTTPEKAQETLEVIRKEFDRLCEGVTEEELQRAKVGLKSSLIMESESSIARAAGIASDYYLLGRVRGLEEIKNRIEELSVESITKCLSDNKFADYTVVTIGPNKIEI